MGGVLIQELIVGAVIIVAVAWAVYKLWRLRNVKSQCDGCPLSDNCKGKGKTDKGCTEPKPNPKRADHRHL